jgi:hypothetical protein
MFSNIGNQMLAVAGFVFSPTFSAPTRPKVEALKFVDFFI